jgi:hypothetical protein
MLSQNKRRKELARQEKQREKDARRQEKRNQPPRQSVEGEDPDLAGIVPGPQPIAGLDDEDEG